MAATSHMHGEFQAIAPVYDRHVLDTSAMTPEQAANAVELGRLQGAWRL